MLVKFPADHPEPTIRIQVIPELESGVPPVPQERIVSDFVEITADNFTKGDLIVAQVTLAVEKAWLRENKIHEWSIEFSRFDEAEDVAYISNARSRTIASSLTTSRLPSSRFIYPNGTGPFPHEKTALEAIEDTEFQMRFQESRAYLLSLATAWVEIANPFELYIFEPYCAKELGTGIDTGGWNTFATH